MENNNKKPSELLEIKELLTHQLQLVSKESEEAHGETLAVFPRGSESAPKAHMLTIDEMPRHTFSL